MRVYVEGEGGIGGWGAGGSVVLKGGGDNWSWLF